MKKIIFFIIGFIFLIFSAKIISLRIINHQEYENLYRSKDELLITSSNAPRGKILDRNGVVLVDNTYQNNIIYYKNSKYNFNMEKKVAEALSKYIAIEPDNNILKEYYLNTHNIKELLTDKELHDYEYRLIDKDELLNILYEKVTDEMLNTYSTEEKNEIMIYHEMNEGYYYAGKVLKQDITEEECASIIESNITGVTCEKKYIRDYKYPELKSILGVVSYIPYEEVDAYLEKGYKMDDFVGISGLEKYYDEYLRGEDAVYKVEKDYSLKLVTEEKKGSDLVLALDINLYNDVNEIIKNNMIKAKKEANTNYFTESFVLISDLENNSIISLSGLEILYNNRNYSFKDVTSKIFTSSFTVGSVVKGASHTVGYLNNAIAVGKKIKDSCIKLYNVPAKCSFKDLGYIDDIDALKMSSNYYQFKTVLNVLGVDYKPNINLTVTENDFAKYRNVFASYGLGVSTNIDYPLENTGIKGSTIAPDLLLNLAIGQYDTYTALGLLSYINTIANYGVRKSLSLTLKENEVLNTIPLEREYYDRIIEGFYEVMSTGTGRGYIEPGIIAAGKTGTSETYYANNITTITSTCAIFMPKDDPKYSVVIINPNVGISNQEGFSYVNRRISRDISKLLMEKYL